MDDRFVVRHGARLALPDRCACCLAPASGKAVSFVELGGGLRREIPLPECATCARRKTTGLVLGIVVLVASAALGLGLGAMLFPFGVMRVVSMVVVTAAALGALWIVRRVTRPAGHAPHCNPIARADVDPARGPTQDVVLHLASAEFARMWRALDPGGQDIR